MSSAIRDQAIEQTVSRGKTSKTTKSQQTNVAKETEKKSWHVSQEAIRAVGVHATMEGQDPKPDRYEPWRPESLGDARGEHSGERATTTSADTYR